MLDEALRSRLEALNRAALPLSTATRSLTDSAVRAAVTVEPQTSGLLPVKAASPAKGVGASAAGRPIPGILRRGEVVATSAGEHLRIRLPIDLFWENGANLVSVRQLQLQTLLAAAQQAVEPQNIIEREFAALIAAMPRGVILLDLETCGLGGSALFLAGVLRQIDGLPTVELLLARNYAEEQAVLETLWELFAGHNVLVTFNGKSFDWPMIVDRTVVTDWNRLGRPVGYCTLTCCTTPGGVGVGNFPTAGCRLSNEPFAAGNAPATSRVIAFRRLTLSTFALGSSVRWTQFFTTMRWIW